MTDADGKKYKKYLTVKNAIKQEIASLKPGDKVGTEIGYTKKFNVSRPTIRHAIQDLIEEGSIVRKAGIGLMIPPQQCADPSSKSVLIMLHSLETDDGMFTRAVWGAVDYFNQIGYSYQIATAIFEESKFKFLQQTDLRQYHGVITTAFDTEYDRKSIRLLQDANTPVVLLDNPYKRGIFSYVVADDHAGGFLIGDYLAKLGHKRILYIKTGWPAQTTENRLDGIRDALLEYDIALRSEDVVTVPYEANAENYILKNATKTSFNYTAIACSNDILAMHVANALNTLKIRIPEDISVTGFGDYRLAPFVNPPLTTVHVSGDAMGREAAKLLSSYDLTQQTKKIILDVHLVERGSTGPVPE